MKNSRPAYSFLVSVIAVCVLLTLLIFGGKAGAFSVFNAPPDSAEVPDFNSALATSAVNGRVAFSSNRVGNIQKIFTVNSDGTGVVCLMCAGVTDPAGTGSTDPSTGTTPAVSPDGSTIAFVRSGQIWLMNSDGSNQRSMGSTPVIGSNPQWSPVAGDNRITFSRNINATGAPNNEIFIINSDGSGEENITNNAGNDVFPSWGAAVPNHPQGRIAFRSSRTGDSEIYVLAPLTPTGLFQDAVLSNVTANPAFDSDAKWSPDGLKLVFASSRGEPNGDIYTLGVGSGNVTGALARLTDAPTLESSPAWSPDGTKIVFMKFTGTGGNNDLFTVSSTPANPQATPENITNNPGSDLTPSWGVLPGSVTPTPTPAPGADLNVALVDLSTTTPGVDQALSYKVRLRNLGPQAATNTSLRIDVPSNTYLITPIDSCSRIGTGRDYRCNISSLASGTERVFDVRLRTRVPGPITLYAGATSSVTDPTPNDRSVQQQLQVSDVPRPSNDNFDNAQPIVGLNATVTGSNVNATVDLLDGRIDSSGEIRHANAAAGKSVWYAWFSPSRRGRVKISTAGSTFDTLLDVHEFTRAPAPVVAFNDDHGASKTSYLTFTYEPDTVYKIAVDGYGGASGNISLKLNATPFVDPGQYRVIQKITGFSPSATCSEVSDPTDLLCSYAREPNGFLRLTIRGKNFTPESKVLIDGAPPTGTDRAGNPAVGDTTFVRSTELLVRVPPNPPLLIQKIAEAGVTTPISLNTGNANRPAEIFNALAANTGLLKVLDLQNAVLAPGETREICGARLFNKEGGETCMSMVNLSGTTIRVSPTWFAALAQCENITNDQTRMQSAENLASGKSFALNPSSGIPGSIQIKHKIQLPPGAALPPGVKPQVLVTGGLKLIGQDGSTLIGQDGGSLVGHDGSSLVGHDGSSLVGHDGSSLIGQDGSTLIGQDGSTLRITAGSLIGLDGSTRLDVFGLDWLLRGTQTLEEPTQPATPQTPGDLAVRSSGYVMATGSGGSEPTITYTYDDVTGEAYANVTLTLDHTSSPKVTSLDNMVFTVGLNPGVIRFQSSEVNVAEGDGFARIAVERSGDLSGAATFDYTTHEKSAVVNCSPATPAVNAGERCDFAAQMGTVRFQPNETSKEIRIPIIDDKHSEGSETFEVIIGNALGAAVALPSAAKITITDNDAAGGAASPLDGVDAQFFVRQQYLDLFGREPLASEMAAGTAPIVQCGSDLVCRKAKQVDLAHAIFSQSQQSWGFVFRLYRAAFGNNQPFPIADTSNPGEAKKWPSYQKMSRDRALLTDGPGLAQRQLELASSFVLRPAFTQKYPIATTDEGPAFVDAVLATIRNDSGVDLVAQRTPLINLFEQAGESMAGRAAVMYRLADASNTNPISNSLFVNAEDARSFASSLDSGYLKRDGSLAALGGLVPQVQAAADRKVFIEQFITGAEYKLRFGPTSADVTITGRVLTPSGQGLRNAAVSLILPGGQRRTALTSSFGLFTFANVPVGSSYTVTVGSKRYRFAPRTIPQLGDNLNLGDLVGLE